MSFFKISLFIIYFLSIPYFSYSLEATYPYYSYKDRDPFLPLVDKNGRILIEKEKKDIGFLSLEGIISTAKGSEAVINGNLYSVGDKIGNFTVVEINNNGVVVKDKNKRYFLKWEGE